MIFVVVLQWKNGECDEKCHKWRIVIRDLEEDEYYECSDDLTIDRLTASCDADGMVTEAVIDGA